LTTSNKTPKTFSKSAFVNEAKDGKERLILQVVLKDDEAYSKAEVEKKLKEWKSKEVKA
jgi:hypothetical protein